MIGRLLRDPIARVALIVWAGIVLLYFLPGVPADFLERLGDRYSTLPIWPWASAACVFGLANVRNRDERRFWQLQAVSFSALLAIELPWALARAGNTPAWDITAEWCYFVYYACQLASAARTREGATNAVAACVAAAAGLTAMALLRKAAYDSAWPSYITYLAFDAAMLIVFLRRRRDASAAWSGIFLGLAITSAIVLVTDGLDMLWYENLLKIDPGMKTDIFWTLPPIAYALVARFGRQQLDPAP